MGTHVDPSAHFHKGLRTVDQIELKEMDPAARVHRRSGAMGTLLLDSEGSLDPLGTTVARSKANV
jgi:kynurenine formamidase